MKIPFMSQEDLIITFIGQKELFLSTFSRENNHLTLQAHQTILLPDNTFIKGFLFRPTFITDQVMIFMKTHAPQAAQIAFVIDNKDTIRECYTSDNETPFTTSHSTEKDAVIWQSMPLSPDTTLPIYSAGIAQTAVLQYLLLAHTIKLTCITITSLYGSLLMVCHHLRAAMLFPSTTTFPTTTTQLIQFLQEQKTSSYFTYPIKNASDPSPKPDHFFGSLGLFLAGKNII
ncbi:MAG: hypothetical protein WBQ73_02950 [Candidatus Babeliales bacterium]